MGNFKIFCAYTNAINVKKENEAGEKRMYTRHDQSILNLILIVTPKMTARPLSTLVRPAEI